ncbi:hypothetical protein GCM10009799_00050 [Nocardiopsis rhodophaea]|uniref:Homoserine dehydrogenase n=1 Tax=Nocardiopsis rhodophaea TaxID=280238 RepID=A0ABN2S1Q1_9ACTN
MPWFTTDSPSRVINVALLGNGTVGKEVAQCITERHEELRARSGVAVQLAGVAVGEPSRHPEVPRSLLTTDPYSLATRADVDVVIEAMGGLDPAYPVVSSALESGRPVVTANKELVASYWSQLHKSAAAGHSDFRYEAAVAGAIPLVTPLRQSLSGDRISNFTGILNGTCNYILTAMDIHDQPFDAALQEAIDLGYAEADYARDVKGIDTADKAAILASLSFDTVVDRAAINCEGITNVSITDIRSARDRGHVIKLIASCQRPTHDDDNVPLEIDVRPTAIPRSHPLATVSGATNGIEIEAALAGNLLLCGPGAGGQPTASAILGDLFTVIRNTYA